MTWCKCPCLINGGCAVRIDTDPACPVHGYYEGADDD